MTPANIPDNSRLVESLLQLLADGKPLYGSYRGRKNRKVET